MPGLRSVSDSGDPSREIRRWRPGQEGAGGGSSFLQRRAESQRRRHADPGWHEWLLREFVRYWYILAAMALAIFVPLQVQLSWGTGIDPVVLGAAMIGLAALLIAVSVYGYVYLWKEGGWIDRAVRRHGP